MSELMLSETALVKLANSEENVSCMHWIPTKEILIYKHARLFAAWQVSASL